MPKAKSGNPIRDKILTETFGKDFGAKEEKENIIYTSFLETEEYILEEIVPATAASRATAATDPQFIIYNKATGTLDTTDEFSDRSQSDKIYRPIKDDLLASKAVLLPSGTEDYESTDKLVQAIRDFLTMYCELPIFYEKFMPHLILFYWVYDRFPFIPYLHFVGRTSTGKTTAMEVLGSICYKPTDASGAITMSSIFRIASKWHGTLLLDEFSSGGDNYQEMISFLKSGVSNKAVLRVEGDKEREVKAYMIKSPKMFTSEDPISDAGLQSRTIVLKMEKNKRKIPLYRLKRYEQDASHLRNKLLLWRLHNLGNINLDDIEYGFPELEKLDRRVQQVITPIYYFSNEETKADIIAFAKLQEEDTLRERRESLEGQIFQVIFENYPTEIPLALIVTTVNKERGSQKEFSDKRIANVVRKILGFDIQRRGHENIRTVVLDKLDKFVELLTYYGLEKNGPPISQVAQDAEVANNNINNIHTDTNGIKLEPYQSELIDNIEEEN